MDQLESMVMGVLIAVTSFAAGPVPAEDSGWRSPEHVDGAVTVSVEQARVLFARGVIFIDVRSPRRYAKRHVPGSRNLDMKNAFTEEALNAMAAKDEPVVIYCSGVKCSRSYKATELAVAWGYQQVHYFRGGVAAWRDANMPLESAN